MVVTTTPNVMVSVVWVDAVGRFGLGTDPYNGWFLKGQDRSTGSPE
jgi:hypothetical protein